MSRFGYLCVALISLMVVSAVSGSMREVASWFSFFESACYIAVLIATLFAVSHSRRTQIAGLVLAIPTIASSIWVTLSPTAVVHILHGVFSSVFLCFVAVRVIMHLLRCSTVEANTLYAAVSGYLLLGLAWAAMYSVVDDIDPAAFRSTQQSVTSVVESPENDPANVFYFSFVTLSTLGYGDIVPVSSSAKLLAIFEVVLGQIYLTILVARLVGLHLVSAEKGAAVLEHRGERDHS